LQKRTITYEDETRETNPQPTSLVGRQQQTTRQTTSEGGDLFIFLFSRKANIAAHLQGFFLHPSEALGSSDFFLVNGSWLSFAVSKLSLTLTHLIRLAGSVLHRKTRPGTSIVHHLSARRK